MATATYPQSDLAQCSVVSGNLTDQALPNLSAVSWGAVAAGAAAAAALSLILLLLGIGLGLSSVSPWAQQGVSATAFGISTILWLTFTQLAASGMGGYIAGRLRTRWTAVHTDEVYFRDTAHGFLAWAVASLVTVAFLGSAIAAIVSGGIQAGTTVAGGAAVVAAASAPKGTTMDSENYFIDSLFRKDMSIGTTAVTPPIAASPSVIESEGGRGSNLESARIFMHSVATGPLSSDDLRYLGQLVAQRTGLNQVDAEKRVSDIYNRVQTSTREAQVAAQDAADKARKASSYAALWLFISLLVGAFVSSYCATFGGRQRDVA